MQVLDELNNRAKQNDQINLITTKFKEGDESSQDSDEKIMHGNKLLSNMLSLNPNAKLS